jgi:ABC-2 type transport system permease protein
MFLLQFKKFFRTSAARIGLLFILLSGLVSIAVGKRFLEQQQAAIAVTAQHQQQHINKHVQYFNNDMGLLLYYLRFALVNEVAPLAGLSIGQRDVNPSIQSVTIRNLEAQRYDTDLYNPANLLVGNLDLGFVFIYLFPLLIIALTYNLYAEEKEGGIWSLLSIQARSPLRVLLHNLAMRMLAVFAAAVLLLVVAAIVLQIPLNGAFVATVLLLLLYLFFWFGAGFWVASWKESSPFSVVSLLAIWVALTILAPALVNNYISSAYPVPEALETALKQRQGYHEKWDMEKEATMKKFYSHYPQFAQYPLPDKQFSWLWYYAMQQMGDDDAQRESAELRNKLALRDNASRKIALALPVLQVQVALNDLAGTGLRNHLQFLDSTQAFHERLRLHFYARIFEEQPVHSVNWNAFRVQYFREQHPISSLALALPLVLFAGLLFLLGRYRFSKSK